MKIAIYTQPLAYNYGGILQNYALQETLRRQGHDVSTLSPDLYLHLSWKRLPYVFFKRFLKKIAGFSISFHEERRLNREHDMKMSNIISFISENIKVRKFRFIKDINDDEFEAIIVGSDQVWRPKYNCFYGLTIENSFLDFAKDWNVKRISYAASFGTDEWEYNKDQQQRCSDLIRYFSAVSVREKSAVSLCKQYLGVNAVQTIDPTFLLDKEDYEKIYKERGDTHKPQGALLYYFLDENKDSHILVDMISRKRNLVPFDGYSNFNNKSIPLEKRIPPSVEQWLRNFHDAEFIVTDSFHACVFSIIFEKQFVVLGNTKRGYSRFMSLLSMFSMEDHLIKNVSECNLDLFNLSMLDPQKLKKMKDFSISFLNDALVVK